MTTKKELFDFQTHFRRKTQKERAKELRHILLNYHYYANRLKDIEEELKIIGQLSDVNESVSRKREELKNEAAYCKWCISTCEKYKDLESSFISQKDFQIAQSHLFGGEPVSRIATRLQYGRSTTDWHITSALKQALDYWDRNLE